MRNTSLTNSPAHNHHSSSPSSSPSPIPTTLTESTLRDTIELAEKVIPQWCFSEDPDHCIRTSLFSDEDTRQGGIEFISVVNNLQSAVRFLTSNNASSSLLDRSQELVQMAIKRLRTEFDLMLRSKREHLDSSFVSDLSNCDDSFVLKSIADCMINCGYNTECVKVYKTARKFVVDEYLYRLGIDYLSLNLQYNKLDWETIEKKIKNWLAATKILVKSIFSGEKTLCDVVLSSSSTIRESCFAEVTIDNAVSVFGFPEQIASKCKKAPEKLFRILDMYETISELKPEIDSIFSSDLSSAVRSQLETSMEKLRETIPGMLAEFESAIQKDPSKSPVTGGGVHPLTRYVMNYLAFLADYTGVLEEILETWKLNLHAPLPEEYFVAQRSSDKEANVAVRFAWIILVLLSKLDRKADIYHDVPLSYLFLANNRRYIVKKVQTSELRLIIGDDWVRKQEKKVKQYAASYERTGWSKVIDPLVDTAEISVEEAREKFRTFNSEFMEVQKKHMEWVVVDQELREEMKESLARTLVSKYHELYMKYREKLARGNGSSESVVRYAPEDLENYLWGMLFGCSDGDSRSRSRAATTSYPSASAAVPSTSSPSNDLYPRKNK